MLRLVGIQLSNQLFDGMGVEIIAAIRLRVLKKSQLHLENWGHNEANKANCGLADHVGVTVV